MIEYNPVTGRFYKLYKNHAKETATSINSAGYRTIWYGGRCMQAHRLAFKLMGKDIPEGHVVDHINRDKADNNRDRARRGRSAKAVPSKWKLSLEECQIIQTTYNRRDRSNNKSALSKRFGVDRKIITQVLEGTYCAIINSDNRL